MLAPGDPALMRFKKARCATLHDVQRWVAQERDRQRRKNTDEHGLTRANTDVEKDTGKVKAAGTAPPDTAPPQSVPVREGPCSSVSSSVSSSALVANAALSLLNLACHLLDRQLASQAQACENGGFTERLHRVRTERRSDPRR